MSYLDDRMSVLAYSNGFTLWHFRPEIDQSDHYRTLDDYLAGAGNILRVNDLIIVDPASDGACDSTGGGDSDGRPASPGSADPTSGGFFRVRLARQGEVRTDPLF